MDDVDIEDSYPINSLTQSKDTLNRIELRWNDKIEYLFRHWAMQCKELAQQHNRQAKYKRCMYRVFGIPSVIIPLCMATISQLYDEGHDVEKLVNSLGYLMTGTLTGINTFLNFAGQYEKHYNAEIRYNELYTDIQSILIKPKRDRIQADVCIERYKLKLEHANEVSPDLPNT
jgi:hypothetical protein